MAFREPGSSTTPRVLVIHPQRAFTSVAVLVLGGAVAVCGFFPVTAGIQRSSLGGVLFGLCYVAFGGLVALLGVHGWLLRVELRAFDDGVLTMTWTRWPLRRRVQTMQLAEVTDVVVESEDGTSKIVVVAGGAKVPLTSTSTSDRLEGKAKRVREFLERERARRA